MRIFSSINLLWLISAITLTTISHLVFKGIPKLEDGLPYILFHIIYLFLILILKTCFKFRNSPLNIWVYIFGVLAIMTSKPIYENDHYRYLWEGRILLHGKNPYVLPPNSEKLKDIKFDTREKIGFSHLTTIYPPIALLLFASGGVLSSSHHVGVLFLMFLNALLVYYLFRYLEDILKSKWLLILMFPYFQKEFIQSVHIDLLAFIFVFIFLINKYSEFNKNAFFILSSIFTKIIGVFFVWPLFLMYFSKYKRNWSFWIIIIGLLGSFPGFYLYLKSIGGISGYTAFSGNWVWNPGFYSILWRGLDLSEELARKVSLITLLFYIGIIGFISLYQFKKEKFNLSKKSFYLITYLFFSGLVFFSPVYNSWYAIWFLIPALLLDLKSGVLYAFFSITCYVSFWNKDALPFAELIGHFFFIPSLIEIYFINKRSNVIK